jgi:hypothetical protein
MPTDEEIKQQCELLKTHRRNVSLYLQQIAVLGKSHIPPGVWNGIHDDRENILRIKNTLRKWKVPFEDLPDDEWPTAPSRRPKSYQSDTALARESGSAATKEEPHEPLAETPLPPLHVQPTDMVYREPEKRDGFDLIVTVSGQEVWVQHAPILPIEAERFELKIDPKDLPETFDTLAEWKEKVFEKLIEKNILNPRDPDEQRLRKLGLLLFEGLFPNNETSGKGRSQYNKYANKAKPDGPLRIRLNVSPDLEPIPWELILCPINNYWPAVDTSRAIVRTFPLDKCRELPYYGPHKHGPLRIVVVMAGPERDLLAPPIKAELENHKKSLQACHEMLQQPDKDVIIEYYDGTGTYGRLIERLEQSEPIHILHVFCHGEQIGDETMLHFVKEASDQDHTSSDREPVRGSSLRNHLRQRFTKFPKERIQLVVLNACFSGSTAQGGILKSLAAELVQEGVPAAIAMQGKIEPKIAHQLAHTLYESLWNGDPIDRALTQARSELYESYTSTLEWAIPVLFLHPSVNNLRLCDHRLPRLEQQPEIGVSQYAFLEEHGLGREVNNQDFFSTSAEDIELARLLETFVLGPLQLVGRLGERQQPVNKMLAQLNEPHSFFLFAPGGYGKTSYRLRMESVVDDIQEHQPLIISFDFARELSGSTPMTLGRYVRHIKRKTHEVLEQQFRRNVRRKNKLQLDSIAWGYFQSLEKEFKPSRGSRYNDDTYWLRYLAHIAANCDFSSICVIFENLNQLKKEPIKAFKALEPLIIPTLLNTPGFAFKFFLSDTIDDFVLRALSEQESSVRIYRVSNWSDPQMRTLLSQLLYYYYMLGKRELPQPITQFSDLCAADSDVDSRLIKAARGSPRELIRLMKSIIDTHCATISDPRILISEAAINSILPPHER